MYQGTRNAPSTKVVVPFFILSASSWVAALLFLLFHASSILHKPFFNPDMLVITHLLVLGFMTSVIIGALFQLLPVIFLQSLYSEKIGKAVFYFLLTGVIGLSASFYFGIDGGGLTLFGTLVNIAVILFVINIWGTIGKSTENPVAKLFVRTSAVWLLITTLIGLLLAINFLHPYLRFNHLELLKVHAHIGIFGWFIFLIIGVSSVLIPMFLLVHKESKNPLYIAYYLLVLGILLGITGKIWSTFYLLEMGYGFVAGGILSYAYFIYNVYKQRMRKNLAYDLKKSMTSYIPLLLAIPVALLFLVGFNSKFNLSVFYIVILLIGFISTLILGMFYKTLPFIIWLKVYKAYVGKVKTLLPKDLYDPKILKAHYYFHIIGFLILAISLVTMETLIFYIGVASLLIGAVLFFINVLEVATHKRKEL